MKTQTEHTPTPWKIARDYRLMKDEKNIADLPIDQTLEDMANAAFIVTACNAHEGLITAIGTAVEIIRNSFGDEPGAESDCQAVRILEAALNAAKGE